MVGTQYIPPTQQQLAAVGYGAPLTVDYKKAIQTLFLDQLKDLLSAQYIYDSDVPKKWWTQDYIGGALHIGVRSHIPHELQEFIWCVHRVSEMACPLSR